MFLFTGCINVNYLEQNRSDGSYFVSFSVSLDKDAIKGDILEEKMKGHINTLLANFSQNATTRYVSNLENTVHYGEINTQNYLDLLNSFECGMEFETTEENYFMVYILITPTQSEDIMFSVNDIFNIYSKGTLHPDDEKEDENENAPQIREEFLTLILEQNINSPYSNEQIQEYANLFLNDLGYAEDGYNLNDIDFSYTYCTDYRRVHSNSNDIDYANGTYYHTWNFTQDENGFPICDNMIVYRNYVNSINWYLIGLGVAVLIVGVVTLTLYLIHKNKQKKEKEKMFSELNIKID